MFYTVLVWWLTLEIPKLAEKGIKFELSLDYILEHLSLFLEMLFYRGKDLLKIITHI